MTIIAGLVTPGGVVLGSESRRVFKNLAEGTETIENDDAKKTYLLNGKHGLKYGLACSGITGFDAAAPDDPSIKVKWQLEDEIATLSKMADTGEYSMRELAEWLQDRVTRALLHEKISHSNENKFVFYLAGYEKTLQSPTMFSFNIGLGEHCQLQEYGNTGDGNFQGGFFHAGETEILKKLLRDETVKCYDMSLQEAIEFVYLTIQAGITFPKYLEGHKEYNGGEISIAVISPEFCGFIDD